MATYSDIQEFVKNIYGISIKTCWIAQVKELNGLPLKKAPNRKSNNVRIYPCPDDKRAIIEEAMRELEIL